jgi:hypothetical protein
MININPEDYNQQLSVNPNIDDSQLIVLPTDEETIKNKEIEIAKTENPELVESLSLPDGEPAKLNAELTLSESVKEKFWKEYSDGINTNKLRLMHKVFNDMKTPNIEIPLFQKMGYGSEDEMLKAIKPRIYADTKFAREHFDSPNSFFFNMSEPISTPGNRMEETTLVGGTWEIPNFYTKEKVAIDKQFFIDENNIKRPLSEVNRLDKLEFAYNDEMGWHYKRGNWSELSTNDLRSFWGIQYGEDPYLIETATMGILNGFVGKGAKGLGYLAGWVGADKEKNVLYNFGRSMEYTSKGIQDEWSLQNITYHTFDGVGQMLGVILMMKGMPSAMISKLGMTSEQAFNASLYTTRVLMGAQAGGAVQDQLIKMGVPEKEARLHSLTAFMAAILSESMIPGNFVEKMAYTGKFKDSFIRNVVADALEKKGISSITTAGKSAGMQAALRNMFAKMDAPMLQAFMSVPEEMLEEVTENMINSSMAPFQNAMMYKNAKDRSALYNGADFYQNGNKYFVKYNDGTIQELNKDDWNNRQVEYSRTAMMLQNNTYLEEDFNASEAIYAGLSTMITSALGLPGNISQQQWAKHREKENVSKAILAKHLSVNPDAELEIREEFNKYLANGAFNKYHVNKDGSPATVGSENMVANDLIEAFMSELTLMAQSMKVFGMESKAAIEAYEGDIELFTEITNVVTDMQRINNALANGIEKNLHGDLITDKDDEASLNNKLQELQKKYEYLAVPQQGKKHSEAYNRKLQDIYIRNAVLESKYLNQVAKEKYNNDFDSLTDEQKKEVRTKVEQIKLVVANTPGFLDDTNKKYHDGIEYYGGHETLLGLYNSISNLVYGNKQKQSDLAKSVFERHNEILKSKNVVSDEEGLTKLINDIDKGVGKISKIKGKISTEKIDIPKDIANDVIQELGSLMQNYEAALASSRAGYNIGASLDKAKKAIEGLKGDMDNLNALMVASEAMDVPIDTELEIGELSGLQEGYDNIDFSKFDNYDLGTMEMGFVDTENLTPEHTNIALQEFAKKPLENMLYKARDGKVHNLGLLFKDFMEQTDGDNVSSPTGYVRQGRGLKSLLESYMDFLLIEDKVIPQMEQDERAAEASPKNDIDSRSLTGDEVQAIRDQLSTTIAELQDRIGRLEGMSTNRSFGQNKRHIADVWERYNILKAIQQTADKDTISDNTHGEVNEAVIKMIDGVEKILSDYSTGKPADEQFISATHGTDPFSFVFDMFAKNDSMRDERQKNVIEILNKLEAVVLKAEEKMSGKLDAHIEIYMKVNNLYDKEFVNEATYEEYQGGKAFDYSGNTINGMGEFLIDPTNIPTTLQTQIGTNNKYKDNTIHWQILSRMDLINEMGRNNTPSLKDVYTAIAEVMETMDAYIAKSAKEGSIYKENLYLPTHEQRQVIIEMINNAFRSNTGVMYKHGKSDGEPILNNAIYLRGFAGGGKTSIITPYYTLVMANLKQKMGNNKFNMQVFTPTYNLMNDYSKGSMAWVGEAMKLMGVNFVADYQVYKNENGSNYDTTMSANADVIIIDEATKMGYHDTQSDNQFTAKALHDNIKKLKDGNPNSKTHFVLIGDDSQVTINELDIPMNRKPIVKYFAKTKPVMEVHRAKVHQLWKLQEFFRESAFTQTGLDRDFLYNEEFGVQSLPSIDDVKAMFVNWYNTNKENKVLTEHDGMIVVENSIIKKSLIKELESTVPNIGKFIYTLKDWESLATNDAAGLSSDNVFVYYDIEHHKKIDSNDKIARRFKPYYDIMLTAASRAKKKVYLSSPTEITSKYSATITQEKIADDSIHVLTFKEENMDWASKMRDIASQLDGNKKTKDNETVLGKEKGEIENQYRSEQLADGTDLKNIAKKITKEVTREPVGSKLSSLAFANHTKPEHSQISIKNRILKNFIAQFNPNITKSQEEAIADELGKAIDELKNESTSDNFNVASYARDLQEIALPPVISRAISNGEAISLPILNGNAYGKAMHVIPTMITVVGEYDGKPVIDIHDTVFRLKTDKNFEISRQMMLYTIKAAMDNGYIVNNAVLSVFTEQDLKIVYSNSEYYNHEYIKENITGWLNEKVDNFLLADEEIYYSSSRLQAPEFGKERMYKGDKAITIKNKIVKWENGSFVNSYLVTDGKSTSVITQDDYNALKTPAARHKEKGFFKSGAEKYKEHSGALYNMTHNIITQIGARTIEKTMDATTRDMVLNNIIKSHVDSRTQMTTRLEKNVRAGTEVFPYVVVSYFDNALLSKIAKKEKMLLEDLKKEGLDFIVQHNPEYNYGKAKIQEDKTLFNQFMSSDNIISDKAFSQIVSKMNFNNLKDSNDNLVESELKDINEALVEMNSKALKLMRDLHLSESNMVMSDIKEVTTSIGKVSEITMDEFLDDLIIQDRDKYLANMETERVEVGQGFTKYALFIDTKESNRIFGNEKIPIYFSSKKIVTDVNNAPEQTSSYIASLLDNFKEIESMFDGIFELEGNDRKTAIKTAYESLRESEAMRFIAQNHNVYSVFDEIYLSFAFDYSNKSFNLKKMTNKKTAKGSINTIKTTLKGLMENVGSIDKQVLAKLRMPIYFNGQYQLGNMITTSRINQPGLFLKQGDIKPSKPTTETDTVLNCF